MEDDRLTWRWSKSMAKPTTEFKKCEWRRLWMVNSRKKNKNKKIRLLHKVDENSDSICTKQRISGEWSSWTHNDYLLVSAFRTDVCEKRLAIVDEELDVIYRCD